MIARQYQKTLLLSEWQENGIYNLSIPELKCGDGTISPLISPIDSSDHEEYDKITKAIATAGNGIVFTKISKETIKNDISIIIIDWIQNTGTSGNIPNGEEMEF